MKKIPLIVLLFLFIASCTETIPLGPLPVNKILVVNSLICPDSLFSCTVSRVYAINDTSNHFIDHAMVKVFDEETGQELCLLEHVTDGYYRAQTAKPQAGQSYRIEINAEGYQTIKGKTSIPFKQEASEVYTRSRAGFDPILNSSYDELLFTITDQFDGANYFEIWHGGIKKWGSDYKIETSQKIELADSIYLIDDSPGLYSDYTLVDAVLQAEGLMRYNPATLVFSDNLFNGSSHRFVVRCSLNSGHVEFFMLFTLSAELYKFRTTLMQQQYEMGAKGISRFDDLAGLDFSSKAIDVYSNITGGYGIFAGYNMHMLFSDNYYSNPIAHGYKKIYRTTSPYEN